MATGSSPIGSQRQHQSQASAPTRRRPAGLDSLAVNGFVLDVVNEYVQSLRITVPTAGLVVEDFAASGPNGSCPSKMISPMSALPL